MIDPLFQAHQTVAADFMPNAADPDSARAVMIFGIIIVVATAVWAVAGLGAAVWVRLANGRDRRLDTGGRGIGSPNGR